VHDGSSQLGIRDLTPPCARQRRLLSSHCPIADAWLIGFTAAARLRRSRSIAALRKRSTSGKNLCHTGPPWHEPAGLCASSQPTGSRQPEGLAVRPLNRPVDDALSRISFRCPEHTRSRTAKVPGERPHRPSPPFPFPPLMCDSCGVALFLVLSQQPVARTSPR